MRPTTSGAAFAAANAAMIQGVDGASTVHVLLADCLGCSAPTRPASWSAWTAGSS